MCRSKKAAASITFVMSDGQYEFLRPVVSVIIPSEDKEKGLKVLKRVMEVAEKAGLQFNWKKCAFLQRRVEHLGYII